MAYPGASARLSASVSATLAARARVAACRQRPTATMTREKNPTIPTSATVAAATPGLAVS
jgi:hypothetical protein